MKTGTNSPMGFQWGSELNFSRSIVGGQRKEKTRKKEEE
jgi:hypothetical protein